MKKQFKEGVLTLGNVSHRMQRSVMPKTDVVLPIDEELCDDGNSSFKMWVTGGLGTLMYEGMDYAYLNIRVRDKDSNKIYHSEINWNNLDLQPALLDKEMPASNFNLDYYKLFKQLKK